MLIKIIFSILIIILLNIINNIKNLDKSKKINFLKIPPFTPNNYEINNKTSNYLYNKSSYCKDNEIFHENEIHSIYGEKCEKCNKLIGEFKFRNYGKIICPGYPRIYRLSNYWNNIWLLGGNIGDGKIYVRRSNDEGINWDNPIPISFYPDHICSNVDFFELENHDIISSYRAIGNLSSDNPEIRYNINFL